LVVARFRSSPGPTSSCQRASPRPQRSRRAERGPTQPRLASARNGASPISETREPRLHTYQA
jgi:hypothetical protein